MRDFLLPLVLILVVVAGVWVYFLVTATHGGPVLANAPIPTGSVAPAPPKVAPHPKPAIARDSARAVAPPAPAPTPVEAQVEERPASPPPLRPIPTGTPAEVNVGMDTKRVVELLGEPDLTALKIDRGNLFETYVYKKKPGQNLAFIRLEGGRVVPPQ